MEKVLSCLPRMLQVLYQAIIVLDSNPSLEPLQSYECPIILLLEIGLLGTFQNTTDVLGSTSTTSSVLGGALSHSRMGQIPIGKLSIPKHKYGSEREDRSAYIE